jgi:hypothetical protein
MLCYPYGAELNLDLEPATNHRPALCILKRPMNLPLGIYSSAHYFGAKGSPDFIRRSLEVCRTKDPHPTRTLSGKNHL